MFLNGYEFRLTLGSQQDSEPIEATFELNDTLYAKAHVPPTEEVYLWLGANVMLAYPLPEAEKLLESKLDSATQNLANCEEDLDFLREQITVRQSIYDLKLLFTGFANLCIDSRGSHGQGVQLGCHDEKEREGRAWRSGR